MEAEADSTLADGMGLWGPNTGHHFPPKCDRFHGHLQILGQPSFKHSHLTPTSDVEYGK